MDGMAAEAKVAWNTLKVTVPSFLTSFDHKENSFTMFVVLLQATVYGELESFKLNRRFTEFTELQTKLDEVAGSGKGKRTNPTINQKKSGGFGFGLFSSALSEKELEARRLDLEHYLQDWIDLAKSGRSGGEYSSAFAELHEFLEVDKFVAWVRQRKDRLETKRRQLLKNLLELQQQYQQDAAVASSLSTPTSELNDGDANQELTCEERIFLKDLVLESIVRKEIHSYLYSSSIDTIRDTVFLGWVREQLVLDHPWYRDDRDLASVMDELMVFLPRLFLLGSRSTKRDWTDRLVSFTNHFFCVVIKAKEEDQLKLEDMEYPVDCPACQWNRIRDNARRVLSQMDVEEAFFRDLLDYSSLKDAPLSYRLGFACFRCLMASHMYLPIEAEEVKKIRTLLTMMPIKPIQLALAVEDPVSLFKIMIKLFMGRPLGAYSLLMRQAEILSSLSKTKSQVDSCAKKVPGKVLKQLQSLFEDLYPSMQRLITLKMVQTMTEPDSYKGLKEAVPELAKRLQEVLNTQDKPVVTLDAALELFWWDFRAREKDELVQTLGNPDLYKNIKRLILSSEAGLSFLGVMDVARFIPPTFNILRDINELCIKAEKAIAKNKSRSEEERSFTTLGSQQVEAEKLLDDYEDLVFSVFQKSVEADNKKKGTFVSMLDWITKVMWKARTTPIDIQEQVLAPVFNVLTKEDRAQLIRFVKNANENSHRTKHKPLEPGRFASPFAPIDELIDPTLTRTFELLEAQLLVIAHEILEQQ